MVTKKKSSATRPQQKGTSPTARKAGSTAGRKATKVAAKKTPPKKSPPKKKAPPGKKPPTKETWPEIPVHIVPLGMSLCAACTPTNTPPATLDELANQLQVWMQEWCCWGAEVRRIVNNCCGGGGNPDNVPAPPGPPF